MLLAQEDHLETSFVHRIRPESEGGRQVQALWELLQQESSEDSQEEEEDASDTEEESKAWIAPNRGFEMERLKIDSIKLKKSLMSEEWERNETLDSMINQPPYGSQVR